jgi:hypothetical protein
MTSGTFSRRDEPRDVPTRSPTPAQAVEEIVELREEIDQLNQAVASHATVDQAIGMMVALGRVSPDQGWAVLREVSQLTHIKLRNVAELVLIWGRTGDLPSDIRAPLEEALDKYGPTRIPGTSPPS